MSFRPVLTLVLSALCVFHAQAEVYFREQSVNFKKVLPPPPEDSSPAGLADLDTVLQVQASRTEAQIEQAKEVDRQSPFSFGRPIFGKWFTSENLPKTKEIFERIGRQTEPICDAAKANWNRERPYVRDTRVQPIVGKPHNTSYPSGHSFGAAMWGIVLAAAFPEHAEQLKQRVHDAMWGRVIGGAHYPTDTQAGLLLAEAVGKELLKSPDTKRALKIMREEIEAVGAQHADQDSDESSN